MTMQELEAELSGFTGTEHHYRHFLGGKYTDGIKAMADKAGAYWLTDAIFSYQTGKIRTVPFQLWTLTVKDGKAVLEMREDSDRPILVSQKIEYTTFPEGTIKFYLINNVLILPSEY